MAVASGKRKTSSAESLAGGDELHRRIAEKAYELYCARGQRHGDDLKDWYEAERAVLDERKTRARHTTSRPPAIGRRTGGPPILESGRPA
jgi:hypothetical protein